MSLASKASCHSAHSRMPPTAGMGEPQWWTALLPGSGSWHRAVGVSRLYRCSRASERMGLQCSISSPDQTPQSVPTEGASASSEGARGTVHIYTICIYVRVRVRACMIMPARLQRWCRRGDCWKGSATSSLTRCRQSLDQHTYSEQEPSRHLDWDGRAQEVVCNVTATTHQWHHRSWL